MVNEVVLDGVKVGEKHPCYIIAEAGVNFNGDLAIAKQLIDAAVEAGADAVKFQSFKAEGLVTKTVAQAKYQTKNIGKEESQFAMLKRLELKDEFHQPLIDYAKEKGITFISTPFDEERIAYLASLDIPYFKAGSSELNNIPYLKKMASYGKPMVISTGMSDLDEINVSVKEILSTNDKLIVLHCTTNYPCPLDEVNLRAMQTMRDAFGDVIVGYSDHTEGIEVPVIAAAMGAHVIEKHLTLDKTMEGPDHKASLEPDEFKAMIDKIREVESIMGSAEKGVSASAAEIAKIAKKSIIAKQNICKGETITQDMLIIKRPGTGIAPGELDNVVGKKASVDIQEDDVLGWEMLE